MKTSFLAKIKASAGAKAPSAVKTKPASSAKTKPASSYVPPQHPPTREPARSWAAVPPSLLARERYRPSSFEGATYRLEHMFGQHPLIPLHGPSIFSL